MPENIFDTIKENDNIEQTESVRNEYNEESSPEQESQVSTEMSDTISDTMDVVTDSVKEDTFSDEELTDPNKINVVIADEECPLVILFGPPACGKTMTLVRLTRFLNEKGYQVSPIRNFRPAYDRNYTKMCDGFNTMISNDDAASSTDKIQFMLVQVMKGGRRLCQILEAPGELYFNPNNPTADFPNFVKTILNRKNRKIWAIMVEPDWLDSADRKNYVHKIHKLKSRMRLYDKTIVVFNKIDKTDYVISPGHIYVSSAIKEIENIYPGLFENFRNEHPISKLWRKYNCRFVPFQTGDYSVTADGKQTFQEGPVEYPSNLWQTITNLIRG